MTNEELRRTIANDPKRVKALMLTDTGAATVRLIAAKGSITTNELSRAQDLGLANASIKLRKLEIKGYLTRQRLLSKTGGFIYVYKSAI